MKKIEALHSTAMERAELSLTERASGNLAAARQHLLDAFRHEHQAAMVAVASNTPEPTRTVLLNSAAQMAFELRELRVAEQLVATALSGAPAEELAQESRHLLERIGFDRHLDLRGVELGANDIQMVMTGDAIAPGMAPSGPFVKRVEAIQTLVYRTAESDLKQPYRDRGDPQSSIERGLQVYISVPRAASFAVSLRVANMPGQTEFRYADSAQVVHSLLDRLELFENGRLDELHKRIPETNYYENFVRTADELAPDGQQVKMVGFTARDGGTEKRLRLERVRRLSSGATFTPTNEPRAFIGKVSFFREDDEGRRTLRLRTKEGEFKLNASDEVFLQIAKHIGRSTGVKISGFQTSKATIEVREVRGNRKKHTGDT